MYDYEYWLFSSKGTEDAVGLWRGDPHPPALWATPFRKGDLGQARGGQERGTTQEHVFVLVKPVGYRIAEMQVVSVFSCILNHVVLDDCGGTVV